MILLLMTDMTTQTSSKWSLLLTNIKLGFKALIPIVLVGMLVMSFTLSIVAVSRTVKIEDDVTALQKQVMTLQEDISKSLQAIESHVMLIEKYAVENYNWFYGDIDLRRADIKINDKSNTKTKKK